MYYWQIFIKLHYDNIQKRVNSLNIQQIGINTMYNITKQIY